MGLGNEAESETLPLPLLHLDSHPRKQELGPYILVLSLGEVETALLQ